LIQTSSFPWSQAKLGLPQLSWGATMLFYEEEIASYPPIGGEAVFW